MWIIVFYDGRVEKVENVDDIYAYLDNDVLSITHVDT